MEFNKLRETPDTSLAESATLHISSNSILMCIKYFTTVHAIVCVWLCKWWPLLLFFCYMKSIFVWTSLHVLQLWTKMIPFTTWVCVARKLDLLKIFPMLYHCWTG